MNNHHAQESFFTGAWLGSAQLILSFSLMRGAGASTMIFFLFLLTWLCGSAAGAACRPLRGQKTVVALLALTIALCAAAVVSLDRAPFLDVSLAAGLLASFVGGLFAAVFYCDRTESWNEVRLVLLYENNGFIYGYALSALLLFLSAQLLYFLGIVHALLALVYAITSKPAEIPAATVE
jgi:hypothetical protein